MFYSFNVISWKRENIPSLFNINPKQYFQEQLSNIESQPTHHLNENSAWNWSLKRCACVYFLIFILVLNASTYIWVYQKDVACFLHLKQLLLFILYRRANVSHPIPSFHHLHVAHTTYIQHTQTYTSTHTKSFRSST